MRKIIILGFIYLLFTAQLTLAADTIYVGTTRTHTTIQTGIDAAADGDTVIVDLGTYSGPGNRDIDFLGKAITVKSENGPENCIIDCNGTEDDPHRGFYFHLEDVNCVLSGFTIINGYAFSGGGIYGEPNSSPTIINCTIKKCRVQNSGAGLSGCDGPVTDCTIKDNWTAGVGGGLYDCDGVISNCTVTANMAEGNDVGLYDCDGAIRDCNISGNWGNGVSDCDGEVIGCTISSNSGYGLKDCAGTISNCIITYNSGGLYECDSTIYDCNISGNSGDSGGGLRYCDGEIDNCNISNNSASSNGGGLMRCEATISNCTITGNEANGLGGGLNDCDGPITNCIIMGNSADENGGGLYDCDGEITSCNISGNEAILTGAGLFGCGGPVTNCIITGNSARDGSGGGLNFCYGEIINCTISGNSANNFRGGGLNYCNAAIVNCIIWDNTADSNPQLSDSNTPTFSCIQGWSSGGSNIALNPAFVSVSSGNYHLKSEAGRWEWSKYIGLDPTGDGFIDLSDFAVFANLWQTEGSHIPADLDGSGSVDLSDLKLLLNNYLAYYPAGEWTADDVTSPCIDAGHPGFDWTGTELWPHGQRINMGAYGGTNQASMSSSQDGILSDLNLDYQVNFEDLARLLECWLTKKVLLAEDLDRDGIVDFNDFAVFANQWFESEDPVFPTVVSEDFESGDFSQLDWQQSGDANWVISDVNYEGSYAAKSGDIWHNQQSVLEVTICLEFGSNHISFYRKVSSEGDYDFLRFYVDGEEKAQWSGDQDWTLEVYPFYPGEHTFKWVYEKDYSASYGLDSAWIDNVRLYFDPGQ